MPALGGKRRITVLRNDRIVYAQVAKDPAADRFVEVIELRRQIGVVDADITLVNERLNESQSMCSAFLIFIENIKRSIMLM